MIHQTVRNFHVKLFKLILGSLVKSSFHFTQKLSFYCIYKYERLHADLQQCLFFTIFIIIIPSSLREIIQCPTVTFSNLVLFLPKLYYSLFFSNFSSQIPTSHQSLISTRPSFQKCNLGHVSSTLFSYFQFSVSSLQVWQSRHRLQHRRHQSVQKKIGLHF